MVRCVKNRYMQLDPKIFQSWLIPVATVFYGMAALFGLAGVVCMVLPGSVSAMVEDLVAGGITEASAVRTWKLIHIVLTFAACAFPALMAVGYGCVLRGRPGKGLIMLCDAFEWVLKIVNGIAVALIVILVYRLIRYAGWVLPKHEGMDLRYAMLVSEALMLIIVGTLFVMLRRFLDCICDSAASIADTLENGRLGTRSIPGFTATGFLVFGLLALLFGLDRMFTMVIVQEYRSSHYAVLTAEHPLMILSGASLTLGALGNAFSAFYLYGFKRKSEKLYHSFRQNLMK